MLGRAVEKTFSNTAATIENRKILSRLEWNGNGFSSGRSSVGDQDSGFKDVLRIAHASSRQENENNSIKRSSCEENGVEEVILKAFYDYFDRRQQRLSQLNLLSLSAHNFRCNYRDKFSTANDYFIAVLSVVILAT